MEREPPARLPGEPLPESLARPPASQLARPWVGRVPARRLASGRQPVTPRLPALPAAPRGRDSRVPTASVLCMDQSLSANQDCHGRPRWGQNQAVLISLPNKLAGFKPGRPAELPPSPHLVSHPLPTLRPQSFVSPRAHCIFTRDAQVHPHPVSGSAFLEGGDQASPFAQSLLVPTGFGGPFLGTRMTQMRPGRMQSHIGI